MASTPLQRTVTHYFLGYPTIVKGHLSQSGWKNPAPFNVPSKYTHVYYESVASRIIGNGKPYGFGSLYQLVQLRGKELTGKTVSNRAILKFQDMLGPTAELGVAFAEIASSFTMVELRALAMARAYKSLKKGRFKDFLKHLDVKPLPKHRHTSWTKPKFASKLWIEYWFGWAPTVGDISSAVEVLQGNPSPVTLTASSKGKHDLFEARVQGTGSNKSERYTSGVLDVICKIQGDVAITNPNLYRASQLGFVNPASILYQTIPFSWFAEWFGNIGDFLNDWSAYFGLTITNAFNTMFVKGQVYERNVLYLGTPYAQGFESNWNCATTARQLEIPAIQLEIKYPDQLSITRAATAISLLTLLFTKG